MDSELQKKRKEFNHYLEQSGAIRNLTNALVKLYELPNQPEDAIKFIRNNLCENCPNDQQFALMHTDLQKANKKIAELERELSRLKGSIKRSSSEIQLQLTTIFEKLNQELSNCQADSSLLKKYLTQSVLNELKEVTTSFNGTLFDCIQSALEMPNLALGVFACDPDAYAVFSSLFDPIIEEFHDISKEDSHPNIDWGESCKIPAINVEKAIISLRFECRRSIENYPFVTIMTEQQFEEIVEKFSPTKCFSGFFKGKFHLLENMNDEVKKKLASVNLMFNDNNKINIAANATRFWPTGRGIYVTDDNRFAVWCNEEDHLRFISKENTGNIRNIYERLVEGVTKFNKIFAFTQHERFGFLTFSPEFLGNTLHLSCQLNLVNLPQNEEKMCELATKLSIKISKINETVYEVCNIKRFGLTEYETVKNFADGINELVAAENS
ncbi:CLUMA_CG010438, isoform A [Clunio marinus]|uniref:arginine kinase n=1 Tax=Clunio marinus TaxID=568069 RepID=A0A1J1IA45_9DIPT|nr:CLUMA_CG010438, isoform A [Clunio marinus]